MPPLKRARWSISLVVVVVAAVGLWFLLKPEDQRAGARDEPVVDAGASADPGEPARVRPQPSLPQAKVAPLSLSAAREAPRGPQIVGPDPDDPHEPGMLPHPLDEAHARIDAENRLIQHLNDVMSFRDVEKMRELILEYRKLDPADRDANQVGYAIIADCIETPGPASLTAAHQFYDAQRHSPLRRFVRRICFENSN